MQSPFLKRTIDMNTRYSPLPAILERHSLKMTEGRFSNWRDTMRLIVELKNGKLPEESNEIRYPSYQCKLLADCKSNYVPMSPPNRIRYPEHSQSIEKRISK
jgi:hypothetical protein